MRFTLLPFCFIISTALASSTPSTPRNEPSRFDMTRYTAGILPSRISAQNIQAYLRSPLKFDRSIPATTTPTSTGEGEEEEEDDENEVWIEEAEEEEEVEEEERKAWRLATELAILKRVWSSRARRDSFVEAAKGMLRPEQTEEFARNYRGSGENRLRGEADRYAGGLRESRYRHRMYQSPSE